MKPLQSRNHARLIVIFLAHRQRRVPKNISGDSDLLGCVGGDAGRGAIPDDMRTEVAAEMRESELSYTIETGISASRGDAE